MRLPVLPPRSADAHKGQFGRLLLIGGSRGLAGAISLCGMAALRAGAGLVRLAVPDRCLETVAQFDPCYMTVPLPEDAQGRIGAGAWEVLSLSLSLSLSGQTAAPAASLLDGADALACGPGMGLSPATAELTAALYSKTPRPLVIDADGLNALAALPTLPRPAGPRVLTPHPGEFHRLSGERDVTRQRQAAPEFARRHGVTLLLKGRRTIVTDGARTRVNTTGNPGMATGGAGDVLTGILAALLGQGMPAWEAAVLAAHWHGLAGDLAAQQRGQISLTARDLVEHLPAAIMARP